MAHKTFISYKYSEAQNLRDRIIKALGDDASYYKGETSDSPDLTDTSTENIKKNLKDMMYDTSVTIVVISPHIKENECPHVPKLAKFKPPRCPIGVYWNTLCLMRDVWTIKTYMI